MDTTQLAKDKKRKKDKKDTIEAILLCAVLTLMTSTAGALLVFDVFAESSPVEKIIYGSIAAGLALLGIIGGLASFLLYYTKYIWSEKRPELKYSAAEHKRKSEVSKRLPGKDLFDALGRYRKKYIRNRIIIISFGMLLVLAIVLMKFAEEGISLWIGLAVGIAIIIVSCIIAGKADIAFKTELDLKKIIAEKNIDTFRLNMDFLTATNHKLFDGIAILGTGYLVVYTMRFCDIVNIRDITHAETFYDVQKINNGTITRCKLRIYLSYNQMITMTMKNESEMELMANELGIRGLRVEEK